VPRRVAPLEHREFDILQTGPRARSGSNAALSATHGRTDALLEFLKDIGVILRHLEDRGIFLDRKTLFGNRLCKFLHPFVGDTPLVGCRSCSDPLLVVCFTLATRLITAAVWSSFGP